MTLFGAGTGVAMGTGVDYTLNGIAYRTFTAPIKDVRVASLRGLDRMEMKIRKDQATKAGWTIEATARQREINIELERVTGATTRMRVVIDDGIFFKDRSTESEVIYQTADALDHLVAKRRVARLSSRD